MKTIKAYVSEYALAHFMNPDGFHQDLALCTCKGMVKDQLRSCSLKLSVLEVDLFCPDDFIPGFGEVRYPVSVYTRGIDLLGVGLLGCSPDFGGPVVVSAGVLYNEMYHALDSGKLTVYFNEDDKGRLYTRVNLHPEEDGKDTPGKVYFPDRSFKSATVGFAEIDLASVREFDTYGFVKGRMVCFGEFNMSEFLDWAYGNKRLGPGFMVHLCKDNRGTSAYVKHRGWSDYTRIHFDEDGKMNTTEVDRLPREGKGVSISHATLGTLYLKDRFGEGMGKELLAKFGGATCAGFRYSDGWVVQMGIPHGCPDLIAAGLSQGFLSCQQLGTRPVFVYLVTEPAECVSFSDEELEQMAEQFTLANEAADAAVQSAIKKGNLVVRGKRTF